MGYSPNLNRSLIFFVLRVYFSGFDQTYLEKKTFSTLTIWQEKVQTIPIGIGYSSYAFIVVLPYILSSIFMEAKKKV